MKINALQQFLPAVIEPLFFDDGPSFGTMPDPAGVIGRALKPAMIAFFHMAAQLRREAGFDHVHDFELFGGDEILPVKHFSKAVKNIRQFNTGHDLTSPVI
jgi:hypothetical protein